MPEQAPRQRLVALPGGPFKLWPVAVIRGAGFPVRDLVELGDPRYAAAVDRLVEAEELEAAGDPRAVEALDAARRALPLAVEAGEARQQALLAHMAARDDFREAILWQNPSLLGPMVDALAAAPADHPRNQRLRRKQRIVARYAARYCGKNDTIGFFGPVCWLRVHEQGEAIHVRPGPRLTRQREVFLEGWAVDAVAELLARDLAVLPWVAPRANPANWQDGRLVHRPHQQPATLGEAEAALLARCDGERPARDLAAEVVADPAVAVRDEAEAYRLLGGLVERGLAMWDLEPPMVPRAERLLRRRLERIGDDAARDRALAVLGRLEAAREAAAAAGSVASLRQAIAGLERTFTELTGAAPARREGQTYGGRNLLYMDSIRDLDVELGPGLLDQLGPPLSLLLHGARWLCHQAAEAYRPIFDEAYDKLAAQAGEAGVAYPELLAACGGALYAQGNRPIDKLQADFGARWAELLGLVDGGGAVHHTVASLRPRVLQAFGGARPSWPQAHQHGADVQIAARSAEAIRRGDFSLVLGELHVAWSTVEIEVFAGGYHDRAELQRLMAETPGRVMMVPPKDFPRLLARTTSGLDTEQTWWLGVSPYPGGPPARRVPFTGLVFERDGGRLWARARDGRVRFDVLAAFGVSLGLALLDSYKLLGHGLAHAPRATVGHLVVCRESWGVPVGQIPFVHEKAEPACFVAARRWARALGLPRFVFVKAPSEMKPFYVDLASSCQVALLATTLRQAATGDRGATIRFTEMLPTPDQAWLPDAAGRRYTSELRLPCVDLA